MANAIDLLRRDHAVIHDLFEQYETANDHDVARAIRGELRLHLDVSAEVVYAAVEAETEGDAGDVRNIDSHLADLLDELGELDADDERLPDLVAELRRSFEDHVRAGEERVLRWAEQIDSGRMERLAERVIEMKESAVRGSDEGLDLTRLQLAELRGAQE